MQGADKAFVLTSCEHQPAELLQPVCGNFFLGLRIRAAFLDEVNVVEENMRAICVFTTVAAWTRVEPSEIQVVGVNLAVVHGLLGELAAGLVGFQNDLRLVQLLPRDWLARC